MRIYNRHRKDGTENLQITAVINDRVWGIKLEKNELLQMARDYIRREHPGTRIEILSITTKGSDNPAAYSHDRER